MPLLLSPSPTTLTRYSAHLTRTSFRLDMALFALAFLALLLGLVNAVQKIDNYDPSLPRTYTNNYYPDIIPIAASTASYIFLGLTAPVATAALSLYSIYTTCSDTARARPGWTIGLSVLLLMGWGVTLSWQFIYGYGGEWAWQVTTLGVDVSMGVLYTYWALGLGCFAAEVARMAVHARVLDMERKRRGRGKVEEEDVGETGSQIGLRGLGAGPGVNGRDDSGSGSGSLRRGEAESEEDLTLRVNPTKHGLEMA